VECRRGGGGDVSAPNGQERNQRGLVIKEGHSIKARWQEAERNGRYAISRKKKINAKGKGCGGKYYLVWGQKGEMEDLSFVGRSFEKRGGFPIKTKSEKRLRGRAIGWCSEDRAVQSRH